MNILHIRQDTPTNDGYRIRLTLKQPGKPDQEAESMIQFALSEQEQEDIRWYLEDYLERPEAAEAVVVQQVEKLMRDRGEELYRKVLTANGDTQAVWFLVRNELADLRVEITTGIAEAASIPWELMCDPQMDSPVSLRVKAFVRVQSNPNISFVPIPPIQDGRVRLLYIACRPSGASDVELRVVANRLLQDLGPDRARFDIRVLRPPTFEQLQTELTDAKERGRPYHIVHFDGHGIYTDLTETTLASWLDTLSSLTLAGRQSGKHGYLLFEHPGDDKMRPVDGQTLGRLLHDQGVPILVLNACQSAMHEAVASPRTAGGIHEDIRAIGSLAQSIVDQGVPAVLGMRYSVYVVTAAQYIGQLYAALAKGRGFGQAATEGRKHLQLNPDRWIGLQPRPLQDWFVPVVYEAAPIELFPAGVPAVQSEGPELDPVQSNPALLRHVPEEGFIGRDETLLALDRAFDRHRVVILHAYAGQGKSSTAVEFARWYAITGGLGAQPIVLFASFESHTDLDDLLNQVGQRFAQFLESQGVDWSTLNEREMRRKRVMDVLRQVPIVWIWDNIESVAGFPEGMESQWTAAEQNDLRDFLHQIKLDTASKARILLTSRRDEGTWLGKLPHCIAMPRMSNSDAAKLTFNLGQEKQLSRSEIADWQPLLDYCAGNPLTLRVLVGQAVKIGLRGRGQIQSFVEAIRSGEQLIEDTDERQGRDKSLGASLDYGFRHAFNDDERPIIALIHLFQGTIAVAVLKLMGVIDDHALPELKERGIDQLTGLLERAKDIGLLTYVDATWFTIHPALPWFLRQLFIQHYDGQAGRSSAQVALRAWVEAVGAWGDYYHDQFIEGNQDVIRLMVLEEANLLHARRLACRHMWWDSLISCMQGLYGLYGYRGRTAEWSRLVDEIIPHFCTAEDEPVSGRENGYIFVMGYRVALAYQYERDITKAAILQKKLVQYCRQGGAWLTLPSGAPPDEEQHGQLRTMATSLVTLGQLLFEEHNAVCVDHFVDAIGIFQRIGDRTFEAIAEFNLGHAYSEIPTIHNLDAAEAAYQRSLDLCDPNDALGCSKCVTQIGMVYHERFRIALKHQESERTLQHHANMVGEQYLRGLALCPNDALTELSTIHNTLGAFYAEIGHLKDARKHYELSTQYSENANNRFGAGRTRFNMALLYAGASEREDQLAEKHSLLLRAQAYVEAALRDYQHYQGQAAKEEADVQNLLDRINQELAKLEQ